MPDFSGFKVIEELHESKGDKNIPIIVMTSKDLSNNELCYLRNQTKGVVRKGSFCREDFLSTIKKAMKSEEF